MGGVRRRLASTPQHPAKALSWGALVLGLENGCVLSCSVFQKCLNRESVFGQDEQLPPDYLLESSLNVKIQMLSKPKIKQDEIHLI